MAGFNLFTPDSINRHKTIPTSLIGNAPGAPGRQGDIQSGLIHPYEISKYVSGSDPLALGANDNMPNTKIVDMSDGVQKSKNRLSHNGLHWCQPSASLLGATNKHKGGTLMYDTPTKIWDWASLNIYLKSHEGRMRWGNCSDAKEIKKHFKLHGVLLTSPETDDIKIGGTSAVTFAVEGSARIPDYWLYGAKEGHYVEIGDKVYAVLVKRDLRDEEWTKGLKSTFTASKAPKPAKKKPVPRPVAAAASSGLGLNVGLQPRAAEAKRSRRQVMRGGYSVIVDNSGDSKEAKEGKGDRPISIGMDEEEDGNGDGSALARDAMNAMPSSSDDDSDSDSDHGSSGGIGPVGGSKKNDIKIPEEYWQVVPVFVHASGFLSAMLYCGEGWTGDAWHIGTVVDIFGPDPGIDENTKAAIEQLVCPTYDDPFTRTLTKTKVREIRIDFANFSQNSVGGG